MFLWVINVLTTNVPETKCYELQALQAYFRYIRTRVYNLDKKHFTINCILLLALLIQLVNFLQFTKHISESYAGPKTKLWQINSRSTVHNSCTFLTKKFMQRLLRSCRLKFNDPLTNQ